MHQFVPHDRGNCTAHALIEGIERLKEPALENVKKQSGLKNVYRNAYENHPERTMAMALSDNIYTSKCCVGDAV